MLIPSSVPIRHEIPNDCRDCVRPGIHAQLFCLDSIRLTKRRRKIHDPLLLKYDFINFDHFCAACLHGVFCLRRIRAIRIERRVSPRRLPQKFATAMIDRYIFAVLERHNFLFHGGHNLLRPTVYSTRGNFHFSAVDERGTDSEWIFPLCHFRFRADQFVAGTYTPAANTRAVNKSRSKPRDHENTAIKLPGQFEVQFLDGTPSLVNLKCFTSERYANATFRSISF